MMEWMKKNDVFQKAFAVALSVLLWLYVVSNENIDMHKNYTNVPVEMTGIESLTANNLVITEGGQSVVSFRVSGKSDRLTMVANSGSVRATADLSHITGPGTYNLTYRVVCDVSDVTITKNTSTVTVEVDRMVSKSVPVNMVFTGQLQEGYIASTFTVRPDAIAVSGPEKLLDTIASANVTFDVSEVVMTTEKTLEYVFLTEEGNEVKSSLISVDTPSVKLHYGVRQTEEIPFVMDIGDYGFISESLVDVFFDPESIAVVGSPDAVSTLNYIDLGNLSLRDVFENDRFTFDVPITLPYGISVDGDTPDTITVTVEPRGVKKTEIELSRDMLPDTDAFEYLSGVRVTVWTRDENNVTPADLDVELVYDESSLTVGRNEIQAIVRPNGEDILVVGSYTVTVEVTR